MNVLVVDDEELIRKVIKEYCTIEKYQVIEASNGQEAIEKIQENEVDLLVLDVMMPKMDGLTAYGEIKKIKNIPTIILSARGEEYDKLTGFDLGVDDYLTKPFSPKELMARMKAIMNRYRNKQDEFSYKGLKIDFSGHKVTIFEEEIKLTPKEYELLSYFIEIGRAHV